uniref:Genome polyprotein n=1 Tax=Rodent pegivirus TaxID=1321391 RepID=A0A7R7URB4_9FLAV|nr:polyprotein [Rodent pegivirus]
MHVFLFLVLGFSLPPLDSLDFDPCLQPHIWANLTAGFRQFGGDLAEQVKGGLRRAIGALPTAPTPVDWGGSQFGGFGSGVAEGSRCAWGVFRNWTLDLKVNVTNGFRRLVKDAGAGLLGLVGVDVWDAVARHAAASMAASVAAGPPAAPALPPPGLPPWFWPGCFSVCLSFLCGASCVWMFRRRRPRPWAREGGRGGVPLWTIALLLCVAPASGSRLVTRTGVHTLGALQSSRACRLDNIGLTFGNCCNETDIIWCTRWMCWTLPGCAVCTAADGCWTSIGAGVSIRPVAPTAEVRREAMNIFGFIGWAGVLAEGLGLGEHYAAGLAAGVLLVGSPTPGDLICNTSCPQAYSSWLEEASPTLATIWELIKSVPMAVWVMLQTMPVLFGALLLFYLSCGRWVQVVLLLLSVPGCFVSADPCAGPHTSQTPCSEVEWTGYNTRCDCPFGLVIRQFNVTEHPLLNFSRNCPETFSGSSYHWLCGWGSWWWHHSNVERPYSHPYMPPAPFSAICYVTTNRTELTAQDIVVYRTENHTSLGKEPVSTCLIDRRPSYCGSCFGGCFYEDGRHDRPFGVCGGGVRDGPWWFAPLATLRFGEYFNPNKSWVIPSWNLAELLASKYSVGFGCSSTHGLINCWSCNITATELGVEHARQFYSSSNWLWFPQPGTPTHLCINPQYKRSRLGLRRNWLESLAAVADAIAGRIGCDIQEDRYHVCGGGAYYPPDGGFVVMVGDQQVIGRSPTVLKSFLGLYVALLVFMASAGARVVPAVLAVLGLAGLALGDCYPPCETVVCNFYACWSPVPCAAYVRGALCVGSPVMWCGRGAELPVEASRVLTPGFTVWAMGRVAGMPEPSAAWFTWLCLKPVHAEVRPAIVCGEPGVDYHVSFSYLAFLWPLALLFVGWRWRLYGACVAWLVALRYRVLYPVRWLGVALQLAVGSRPATVLVLALAWWVWCWGSAEAALARSVVAGPALGWACRLPTWVECFLAVLCVALYYGLVGRARLAALAAYKISRGLGGFLLLAFLLHRGSDRGVLGYELCFPLFEQDWSVDEAWWFFSCCFSSFLLLFALYTPLGRRAKLRLYAKWCRWYCWLELRLAISPLGVYSPYLGWVGLAWLAAGVGAPVAASWVCVALVGAAASVDLLDWMLEVVLTASPRAQPLVACANTYHAWLSDAELRAFLQRRWARGEVLYDHAGQVADDLRRRVVELQGTLEPLAIRAEELRAIHDDTYTLTCGRFYGTEPVVARCGATVLVGAAASADSLPPGYSLTAPFVCVRKDCSWLKILKVSMTGRAETPQAGQICSLRTALSTSMGCGVSGVLYATFHGTKGRALASPHGPRNPFWSSPSEDVVCYPLLPPMTSLEPCCCGTNSRWVLTRAGALIHGTAQGENRVQLDCATPISRLKGASGTPVLCDKGHAVGMMVGVSGRSGVGESVRFVVPWKVQPGDVKPAELPEFPTVPASGYKEVPYIAPTGSGKSTKFPAKLAQDGHNVLVLNPSVVTTKAMHGYMKTVTGKAPNVFAGTGKGALQVKTGSKITYATYGRFLVNPTGFLQGKDVVICDECHASDGTSVLGIGVVRTMAEQAGVKLLVMATATPPGTQLAPHSNITETALDGDGDVPFYGLSLKSGNYLKGRHLIFCHSKNECQRVAEELARLGAHTVTYWRGKSASVLTSDPDLTVVATDAISTGYTGNFATVTDCCSVVQEDVDVDLNPTFTVGVSVGPADAALRMQRRGRCGRGTPGTYYYTVKGAPPSGVASSATAWAASEAAFMWYGMLEADVAKYLEAYQACPYTARLPGGFGDAVRVLGVLKPYFHCAEVTQEALRETQWPMLTGIQRHVCLEADAAPPSDDVRWAGVHGTGSTPLLYRLGAVTAPTTSHPLALKMAAALGDTSYHDVSLGPVLLAGAAIAAACAVADATGVLVLAGTWNVVGGGSPVYPEGHLETRGDVAGSEPIPPDALQEVVTSLDWPWLTTIWGALASGGTQVVEGCAHVAGSARDWWLASGQHMVRGIPTGGPGARVLQFLETHLTAMLAGGLALGSARSCPPFAILSSVVCGAAAGVPTQVSWLLTMCASAAGALVGGPVAGCGMGAGFWLGQQIGSLGWVDTLLSLGAGYEACISSCALVLDLLDGRATLANALPCLTGLLCPGAAVAGIAMALILRSAASGDVSVWMNRLLSMLPRSSTLPDGFFAEKKDVKMGDAVRSLSLIARIRSVCEATKEPEYVYTSATWVGRLFEFAGVCLRLLIDFAGRWLPNVWPKLPIYACQPPYRGPWRGAGTAVTRCTCGREVTLTKREGGDPTIGASSFCSSAWGDPKGFPINTTTKYSGSVRPCFAAAADVSFMVGNGNVVRLRMEDDVWSLVETSLPTVTTGLILAAGARGPVEASGKCVSNHVSDLGGRRFKEGQSITYNGIMVTLPHRLSFRVIFPNNPFAPTLLPQTPDDGEAEPATTEAVEAALQAADEATAAADAVVATAVPLLERAFEARREAEYAEWATRERALGKVLGRNMVACDAVRKGCLDPMVLEWLDSQPDAVGPPEDAARVKVSLESTRATGGRLPTSLGEESVTDGFARAQVRGDAQAIAGAVGAIVAAVPETSNKVVKAVVERVVRGGGSVVRMGSWLAGKVSAVVGPTVAELREEVVPSPLSGPKVKVQFTYYCEGHKQVVEGLYPDDVDLAYAARDAGVPWHHPHVYRWGGVPISSTVLLKALDSDLVRITASCPATKAKTVMRKVVHRCCGADDSVTKHFKRDIPVSVVKSLYAGAKDAVVVCEDVTLTGDEAIGDVGTILEVVHEEPCGMSYVWSGRPIQVDEPRVPPVSRPMTAQLRARADRVYVTNPRDVHQRIAKVTIEQRVAEEDRCFLDAYNLALAKANRVRSYGFSYEEAVAKVRPGSARGHVEKISVADLKTPRGRDIVLSCLGKIREGTAEAHFMLRPKAEVFPQTKPTFKPPRLIVYPSLEFRVAEKMLLGDPSVVAKAVMGRAYGFQHAPHERARVLVDMWSSKKSPVCYTVDGVCFDSTITPEDIAREGEIFAKASNDPLGVRELHKYYATSPMVDPSGNIVGIRRCRASGTLTTSAGNSITCYLKVSAACRKAGLRDPSFLIHGDDVVIICEKTDTDQSPALKDALASYGYDCVPTRHADLTSAESCSASVDSVRTVRGVKHVLRCDMRRGLGRTIAEIGDPVGTAWGYCLNYPTHPISMYVLLPLLLQTALNNGRGVGQAVVVDVRGNSLELPLRRFGAACRGLHGPDILAVTGHSATCLQEAVQCLAFFDMRGLNHWRRNRRKVKVRLCRAGRDWAALARELLWDPGDTVPPVLRVDRYEIPPDLWEHSWEGLRLVPTQPTRYRWLVPCALATVALMLLVV